MTKFMVGEKAVIIDVPEERKGFLNKIVTIMQIDGYDYGSDDVYVRTETGNSFFLKESQLRKIDQ